MAVRPLLPIHPMARAGIMVPPTIASATATFFNTTGSMKKCYKLIIGASSIIKDLSVLLNGDGNEHQSEHGEHQCLDKTDKKLEAKERYRYDIGRQKARNDKQHFPSKNVAE